MAETRKQISIETTHREKTILVVEDDAEIAAMLTQTILEETRHKALLASNGLEALDIIKDVKPDLLILNYRLPRMSGIEFYDKASSEEEPIPTIMVSANLPRQEIAQRKIVSIHKPFELDELLNTIEKLLV